jgi:hypothetical protein
MAEGPFSICVQQINVNASGTCEITNNKLLKHGFSIGISICAVINTNTKLASSEEAFSMKFTVREIYLWICWGIVLIPGSQSFAM